MEAILKEVNTK